jgi:hypothetical protein
MMMAMVMNLASSLIINISSVQLHRGHRFLLSNGSICQKNGGFPGICVALPIPTLQEAVIS